MFDLLNCPFCGSRAVIETGTFDGFPTARAICIDCGIRTETYVDYEKDGNCVLLAVKDWNRREKNGR